VPTIETTLQRLRGMRLSQKQESAGRPGAVAARRLRTRAERLRPALLLAVGAGLAATGLAALEATPVHLLPTLLTGLVGTVLLASAPSMTRVGRGSPRLLAGGVGLLVAAVALGIDPRRLRPGGLVGLIAEALLCYFAFELASEATDPPRRRERARRSRQGQRDRDPEVALSSAPGLSPPGAIYLPRVVFVVAVGIAGALLGAVAVGLASGLAAEGLLGLLAGLCGVCGVFVVLVLVAPARSGQSRSTAAGGKIPPAEKNHPSPS